MPKIPSLRRHKASGQLLLRWAKDFYCGKFGTDESRAEYEQLVSEWLRLKGKKVPPQLRPKSITVADAANRYLEFVASRYSLDEQANVKGMLKAVCKLYLHERAENIGPLKLLEIRKLMLSQDWCRSYVNAQIRRVNRW